MSAMPGSGNRREFLRFGMSRAVVPVLGVQVQDSLAGRGAVGTLRDPTATGAPRRPTEADENEAEIQAIETRLACNCGCTLDVFTCRTTDFSCTYSPKLHLFSPPPSRSPGAPKPGQDRAAGARRVRGQVR